ncbi:uncharacterized protein LOC129697554 [Leucoraja erinacea]|uniref:uncharacterized protein LOC129697554 n=1 Tax=Leucoraja erinaceus TaxID=7782 RepID=UPI002456A168|nr:uncharacterized protein LOC129697554 [Leucoraja erinacea]
MSSPVSSETGCTAAPPAETGIRRGTADARLAEAPHHCWADHNPTGWFASGRGSSKCAPARSRRTSSGSRPRRQQCIPGYLADCNHLQHCNNKSSYSKVSKKVSEFPQEAVPDGEPHEPAPKRLIRSMTSDGQQTATVEHPDRRHGLPVHCIICKVSSQSTSKNKPQSPSNHGAIGGEGTLVREVTKIPMVTLTELQSSSVEKWRTFQEDNYICSTPPIRSLW